MFDLRGILNLNVEIRSGSENILKTVSGFDQKARMRIRKPGRKHLNLPVEHHRLTGSGCGTVCEAGWS